MSFTPEITNKRLRGIGGSEVAAILGLSSYSSPYKVWLTKTGRETFPVDNKYTRAGTILEGAVAQFFEAETQYRIIKSSAKQKVYQHPEHQFAIGMPDRIYVTPESVGKRVLECKTTQSVIEDVPDEWFCQLQWYLGVVGMTGGAVAWLERGLDFKFKEFEFDADFWNYMIEAVAKFWKDHIEKDTPPDPLTASDVEYRYKYHTAGNVIQATPELIGVHEQLKLLRAEIKEKTEKEQEMIDSIKLVMRDAEAVMNGPKPIITSKTASAPTLFNKESFKNDHPELYEQYIYEGVASRRFLIK